MDFGSTIPLIKNSIDVRSPGVRLSAYFINGFEHGTSNPLLEFELYNTDHLMLNLRHGRNDLNEQWFVSRVADVICDYWMISQVVYTRTLHNNPLFLHGVREQGGKASHCATNRISPAFCKAALCSSSVSVCVRSFGVMWKCGELNGSGISPVLWPVTYGPAHDRQGTACFICGQRGLFTFLFQLFSPPASSFLSFSIRLFLLESHPALTRPHISCSSCCNAEVYWQFAQSLSREF